MLELCQPPLPFRPPLAPPPDLVRAAPSDPVAATPPEPNLAAHLAKGQRRPAGTIWRRNPREQGLLGLTDAIGWFGAQGWSVSLPLIDSQPYDLIVDDGTRLQRVQVKMTTRRSRGGRFIVQVCTRGGNRSFHTAKPFDPTTCDLVYVLTDEGSRYLIPSSQVQARTSVTLGERLERFRLLDPSRTT